LNLRTEILKGEIPHYILNDFPSGCCGFVSEMFLMPRLLNAGFISTKYVGGRKNEKGESHAWLEYKDYIIDITADQFPEITEPVLIIKKEASEFHKQFELD
jgi:hypothetical protein